MSRGLLKFWETNDNISSTVTESTVQDRDIVAMEH